MKVKMSIVVEVTHFDSIEALVGEVQQSIGRENDKGMLMKSDGDKISWTTDYK